MSIDCEYVCLVKNLTKEKPSGKKPWLREKRVQYIFTPPDDNITEYL
jgi:hypothetical protein